MAVSASTPTTVAGLFKKVYSSIKDLLPEGYPMQELAAFDAAEKAGESISYAIVLSHENGLTLAGTSGDVVTFEDAQSGVVKQALIKGCESFVSSAISTGALSRSAAEGEAAFKKASVSRVKSNIKSHNRFIEQMCLYGQDASGLGRVAYFTGTWQGASFTAGAGTLAGIVFATGGVNIAAKKILINPQDYASGIWLGAEGMPVRERAIGGAVTATGLVVSVDLKNAIVEVDFVPTVASGASSHCLELINQNASSGLDFLGAKGILSTDGSVFGISNAVYGIWKGSRVDNAAGKLTFAKLVDAVMEACNKGLDKDVVVLTSFESWADLMSEQAALRKYDSNYEVNEAVNGMEGIKFHSVNGEIVIKPSRFVRRADSFILAQEDWKRVGSSDLTMKIPGLDDNELVQKPTTTNAFTFRSYSDQALICLAPCQSVYISNIDPAAAS